MMMTIIIIMRSVLVLAYGWASWWLSLSLLDVAGASCCVVVYLLMSSKIRERQ